jgi:multiple sugar transport system substrate-binding protein
MFRRSAACLALLLLLTGCSTVGRPAPAAAPAQPTSSTVTLKVAVFQGTSDEALFDLLFAAYQDAHKHVRLERVPVPTQDYTPMMKMAEEGTIDLVPANTWKAGEDRYVNLSPYLTRAGLSEQSYGTLLEERRIEGKLIGLPVRVTPYLIWGNKQAFDQAGVPLPTGGWTWEQFRTTAAKLGAQRTDGQRTAFLSAVPEYLAYFWVEEKTGKPFFEADAQTIKDGLSFVHSLVQTDRTIPLPPSREGTEIGFQDPKEFWAGQAPMTLWAVASIPGLLSRQASTPGVEVLPIPTHPGGRPVTIAYKAWYGVAAKSANVDAAFDFLKFIAGPDGAMVVAKAGYFPAVPTDAVAKIWADWNPPLPALATLVTTRLTTEFPGKEGPLEDQALRTANQVMRGTQSVDEAVAAFAKEVARVKNQK